MVNYLASVGNTKMFDDLHVKLATKSLDSYSLNFDARSEA